jgi:hypothetical protein
VSPFGKHNQLLSTAGCRCNRTIQGKDLEYVAGGHYRIKIAAWNEITTFSVVQAWDKLVYQEDKSYEESETEDEQKQKKNNNRT